MEPQKESKNHESISLIVQDIGYIKKDILKLTATIDSNDTKINSKIDATDTKLDAVLNHYIQRDEFTAKWDSCQNQLDKRIEGIHERLKEKLDAKDFQPYKTVMDRLNWMLISTLAAGVLALLGWTQLK